MLSTSPSPAIREESLGRKCLHLQLIPLFQYSNMTIGKTSLRRQKPTQRACAFSCSKEEYTSNGRRRLGRKPTSQIELPTSESCLINDKSSNSVKPHSSPFSNSEPRPTAPSLTSPPEPNQTRPPYRPIPPPNKTHLFFAPHPQNSPNSSNPHKPTNLPSIIKVKNIEIQPPGAKFTVPKILKLYRSGYFQIFFIAIGSFFCCFSLNRVMNGGVE